MAVLEARSQLFDKSFVRIDLITDLQVSTQPLPNGIERPRIAPGHTLSKTMRVLIIQQGRADIVRTGYNFDLFAIPQTRGDTVVIDREAGRIAFADIGQHAQQMMCP